MKLRKRRHQLKKNVSTLQQQGSVISSVDETKNEIKVDGQRIRNHITFTKKFNQQMTGSINEPQEPLSVQPMITNFSQFVQNEHTIIFDNNQQQKQQTQFNLNDQQIPSFRLKLNSLMKVIYKSDMYRKMNILVNIIYMFGVLLQLPDKMCYESDDYTFRCGISYYIQVICLLMICPLFMIKVLRMVGIDSFKCIIELLTFVCGILWVFRPLVILRYVKMLRPLRILVIIRDTSLIVPTYNLFTSVKSISKVLFPAILTIYIYATIGLYTFSGNQYDRCRDPNVLSLDHEWTAYDQQIHLCGQRGCPLVNGTQFQCLNPLDHGVEPNPQELKYIQFGNGLMRYHNIFISFLITYQNSFITGSTHTVLLQKQVLNSVFVLIFYYSFIYLLSYIYYNIFYGLMIVNQEDHIQTKEQYEALTDNTKQIVLSEVQKRLIRKYERIFSRLNKRISILSSTNKKLPSVLYHTQQNISSAQIISTKRTGHNLDVSALKQAAAQHQITKQIIIEFQNSRQNTFTQNLSFCEKIINCTKESYHYFNVSLIILTCINICTEHSNESDDWQQVTNICDLIFFLLFFFDFLVRYFIMVSKNQQNTQKQLVVKIPRKIYLQGLLLSVCMTGYLYEILIAQNFNDFYRAETKIQKIFRSMLYLRILILLGFEPYFKQSRKILEFAFEAVKQSANFIFLWLIVLIMFSMMGYFLFGDCNSYFGSKQCYDSQLLYSASYQGIFESIITTGIIMLNEDWDKIMQELFLQHGYLIVVWNFIVITFGIMIFSKYFMTYLLNELDTKISQDFDKQNQEKVQQKQFLKDLMEKDNDSSQESKSQSGQAQVDLKDRFKGIKETQSIENLDNMVFSQKQKQKNQEEDNQEKQRGKTEKRVNFRDNKIAPLPQKQNKAFKTQYVSRRKIQFRKKKEVVNNLKVQMYNIDKEQKALSQHQNSKQQFSFPKILPKKPTFTKKKDDQKIKSKKVIQNPCVIFQEQNTQQCYTKSIWYKTIKSTVLIIMVIVILFESPQNDPTSTSFKISNYCSIVIDSFFIIDMIGKFFAFGLKNWFSKFNLSRFFDLVLNIMSIMYFTPLGSFYAVRKIYAFRCFRVFYWINLRCQNSQSMRVTAQGFVQLIPKILKLLFLIWLIYGFFANIIVRVYKEQMWECVNSPPRIQIMTKTDCLNYGGDWVQQTLNATNFGQALLYIFFLASTEDWMNTMNYLSNVKEKDMQPIQSSSNLLRIFFMVFMFFANIIVMNIFVGVCINNFKQIKKKVTGETNLSRQQKQWVNIKNQIYLLQPQPIETEPQNEIRKIIFKIAKSKVVLGIKIFQLVGLLLLLSFIKTNMSHQYRRIILIGQYSFLVCSFCIFVINLIAFGIKKQNLLVRIMQIVLYIYATVFLLFLTFQNLSRHEQRIAGGILVAIQLIRNFLFIQQFEFFQKMFNSLMTILPKTKEIFFLMITTLFIYTAIGIQIFGYLKPGEELNQLNGNYATFGSAVFSLIKFSLWQEAIQQIRDGLTKLSPDSVCFDIYDYETFQKYGQNGCGNAAITILYFITFNLIFSLILLPTLMGIIFDQYNQCNLEESASVSRYQLMKIKQEWKQFDPQGKGYIGCRDLWLLASKIIKIYKLKAQKLLNNQSKQEFLNQMNLSIYEDPDGMFCFGFHQLILAFTKIILIKKQKNSKKKQAFRKDVPFNYEYNNENLILKNLKKTPYKSCHVHTLLLLKSGLQSWKNKIIDKKKETFFKHIRSNKIITKNRIEDRSQKL